MGTLAAILEPGCVCAGNSPVLSRTTNPETMGGCRKWLRSYPEQIFIVQLTKHTNNTQQYLLPIYPLCNVISPAYGIAAVLVHVSFHYKINLIAKTSTG